MLKVLKEVVIVSLQAADAGNRCVGDVRPATGRWRAETPTCLLCKLCCLDPLCNVVCGDLHPKAGLICSPVEPRPLHPITPAAPDSTAQHVQGEGTLPVCWKFAGQCAVSC